MSHVIITLLTLAAGTSAVPSAELPTSLELTSLRGFVVQHSGRWPPLDTLARDMVESVTGDEFPDGRDPVLLLLGWTFSPTAWMRQPLITLSNAELRRELQLPADQVVFSYSELLGHQHVRSLIDDLANAAGGKKLDPLQSKVSGINQKLITLQRIFGNRVIRPVPDPKEINDITGAWLPIMPGSPAPVREAWDELKKAFVADDNGAFQEASAQLIATAGSLPAAYRPAAKLVATELTYNRVHPFRLAWQIMLAGTGLAALAMAVRQAWFDKLTLLAVIAGFGAISYGLSLRWQIAGRIPASNMFESLLFLSWGMGLFAILAMFFLKNRLVPFTTLAMGAVALLLADLLPMDHFVRPITPVLMDTVWMSIHVPLILVSYSVLAAGVLVAHLQLIIMAVVPGRRKLIEATDGLHCWYIHIGSILLLAGIATGSVWAASSWGRYWGWDPKEVWSLVALLGYLTILHVRLDKEKIPGWAYGLGAILAIGLLALVVPKLAPLTGGKVLALSGMVAGMVLLTVATGQLVTALKSIMCFWLIIMTYVGVNYVLGIGLHSYGFGTGAVARYMFLLGGIDLVLVAICALTYLVRRNGGDSPESGVALPVPN